MKSLNSTHRRIQKTLSAVGVLGLISAASITNAAMVVVPGIDASVEGNSANGFPFDIPVGSAPVTMRYQQIYNASAFSSVTGPSYITQIAFRVDAASGAAFSASLPDFQISLSTSGKSADNLSGTFANNVGADNTVVMPYGSVAMSSSASGPANGPKNFDIILNLATPFLYNPANGSLLMDVTAKNWTYTPLTTYFDAQQTTGDAVSRAFTFLNGNYTSANADVLDTAGLVTQFTVSAVPEPATYAWVAGVGALGLAGISRRKNRK